MYIIHVSEDCDRTSSLFWGMIYEKLVEENMFEGDDFTRQDCALPLLPSNMADNIFLLYYTSRQDGLLLVAWSWR